MPKADSKNSSGQALQQTSQTDPYPSPYPQQSENDNIDLYELLTTIWNRKWLVIAVTIIVALGSIVYALQLQPIYKAEALLLPPKAKNIQSINVQITRSDEVELLVGDTITPKTVFTKFKENLDSRILQKKFIQKYGLMELLAPVRTPETRDEDIITGFAKLFKHEDKKGITSLSIELNDPEIATHWVNNFVEFIDKETIAILVADIRNSIANKIRNIEYTIGSKRYMAKQRREDQIVRYREAADVAEYLGIKRRVDATNIIQNTQMNIDIATATTPLYYLGYEALMSQITILDNRKSDDPFISGLRDLQEQLTLLRSIKFDKEKVSAVLVDQAAYPSNFPIKPNRRTIVSISTAVGLLLGIFLAFFVEFVNYQRKMRSR